MSSLILDVLLGVADFATILAVCVIVGQAIAWRRFTIRRLLVLTAVVAIGAILIVADR